MGQSCLSQDRRPLKETILRVKLASRQMQYNMISGPVGLITYERLLVGGEVRYVERAWGPMSSTRLRLTDDDNFLHCISLKGP